MEALEPWLTLLADLSWAFEIDVAQDAVWPSAVQGSSDDHALSIDIFGNSLSSEPFVAGPLATLPAAGESGDDAAWQYYDLAETFSLHSRPGADHVIYIYTIGFGVSESKDTAYDTALLIDAVTLGDAVNAPLTAVNDNVFPFTRHLRSRRPKYRPTQCLLVPTYQDEAFGVAGGKSASYLK